MTSQFSVSTRSLVLHKSPVSAPPGKVYHNAKFERRRLQPLKSNEILVKVGAAAFNHRDLWIRKGMYPGIQFGTVLGADAAGTAIASGQADDPLLNQRVLLVPMQGWQSHPDAPEDPRGMALLGGGWFSPFGTFTEYVVVERDQVIESPSHLDDVHIAAWPLAGVTAWRATMVNARVEAGHNILITGIGGGVAITALQLCVAKGANVYVTSGDEEKISKAVKLGAKGGVNYKDPKWSQTLGELLKKNGVKALDAVIDSGGGNIVRQTSKHLKLGGRIVIYGMTADQKVTMTMAEVMKNQQIIGSTMGSVKDLQDATRFLAEKRLTPVVSHVIDGLQNAEEGFELMQRGGQFGKIVINMGQTQTESAKL